MGLFYPFERMPGERDAILGGRGERMIELPEGAQAYRCERLTGSFKRVITKPDVVNPEKVNATYRDGVRHNTVQCGEALQSRKIDINGS